MPFPSLSQDNGAPNPHQMHFWNTSPAPPVKKCYEWRTTDAPQASAGHISRATVLEGRKYF